MKLIQKLTNEKFARIAARFMRFACYFAAGLLILCAVMSVIGRQAFTLHTGEGTFENAIYAEENHNADSRGMTVHMGDDIHVWTNKNGSVDLSVQIGLSLMYMIQVLPMIAAFWFLSRVFSNIERGQIFTEQNSLYLLCYGLLQFLVAVPVPFIKLLICWLTNLISDSRVSIATGQAMLNMLVPSIAFIVAAYIIHYGVHLQDEVDHTI